MKKFGIACAAVLVLGAAGWRYFRRPPVIASGRLRAVRQSDIGSESAGTIEKVLVDEGDRVRAGQVLIELRRVEAERQVEQAQLALATTERQLEQVKRGALPDEIERERAELQRRRSARELAEQDFERAVQLFEKRVLAKADLDRARSALDQARASEQSGMHSLQVLLQQPRVEDLRVAVARVRESEATLRLCQEQVRKRTISAPADGLILKRKVEPGQSVIPGSALLVLSMMDKTEVYVETDENNLRKLCTGQRAIVVAPSFADRPFSAVLTQINPDVDHARGVVGLRLRPESLPEFARPDMTLDVNIEVARIRDALSLPATALLESDGKAYVLEVKGEKVESVPVTVLGRGDNRVAVSEIHPGALVILRAADSKAGAVVRPKEVRP
jgi:HlyD family secretion protein